MGSVLIWLFYENSLRMERQMERQLAIVLNGRIDLYLEQVFAKPVNAANAAHRLFRQGYLNAPEPQERARQLANAIATLPEITALNFGFEDGRHIGVNRSPDKGDIYMSVITSGAHPFREVFLFNANGGHDQFLFRDQNPFVPVTRPWYRSAIENDGPTWYPIFRNAASDAGDTNGFIGMGFSLPEYDGQNRLIGVINSDIALSQISSYLKLLPLVNGGVVFVANEQNQIIGISNDIPLFHKLDERNEKPGTNQLIRVDNNESPLLRAAAERVLKKEPGFGYISLQDNSYLENVHEFKTETGLLLKVVVLLPENHFFPITRADLKSVILYVLTVVLIVIGLVLLLASRLSKPIMQMTHWAEQLSQGDWTLLDSGNEMELKNYPVKEIRGLSNSFSTMAANLHDTVSNLEERVAERTAELEQVNSNLFELSNTDGLTGIPNRRKFDEVLTSEWNRATRTGQPLVAAIIDVDWFKKYNDHYGHLAGDDCLRKVAGILKSKIRRSSDLVARYGGEEFAIISPGINKANAIEMANIICSAIADANLPHAMSPFGMITVSVGVALIIPSIDSTPATLISAADQALYHAKDSGRNQVICAEIEAAGKEKYAGSEFHFDQI